jgi:hypothetical protein
LAEGGRGSARDWVEALLGMARRFLLA